MSGKAPETEKEQANISPFNFFDVVDFGRRREEDYSSVLAWLLRTEEEHGLANEVLLGITDKLGLQFSDDTYNADTEKNYGGRMLDITVDTDNWHIVIENKVRKQALNDPKLAEEYERAKADTGDAKEFAFIFLYPARMERDLEAHIKEVIANDDAYRLTWGDVADVLADVAEREEEGITRLFLVHFGYHIKEKVEMEFKMDAAPLNKHAANIKQYLDLYLNERKVKENCNRYLQYVWNEVLADPVVSDLGLGKIGHWKGRGLDWTPYVREAYVKINGSPDFYFFNRLSINKDNLAWYHYTCGNLPLNFDKKVLNDLEKISSNTYGNFDCWDEKVYIQYEAGERFSPEKWEEHARVAIETLKAFILKVHEYLERPQKP